MPRLMSDACHECGQLLGAPHTLLRTDCILGHAEHVGREFGYACKRHYHWIDRTLTQIEELFALLDDVILPGPAGDIRSGTMDGSPAPGRVEVMALTDRRAKTPIDLEDPDDIPDVPGSLASWASIVIEERGMTLVFIGDVTASIRVLRGQRQWIAAQDWVDDYVSELAALHRAVARGAGDSLWPRPIGKCPNCSAAMYPTIGVDEAHCGRCGSTWAGIALARLRLIHEREGAKA